MPWLFGSNASSWFIVCCWCCCCCCCCCWCHGDKSKVCKLSGSFQYSLPTTAINLKYRRCSILSTFSCKLTGGFAVSLRVIKGYKSSFMMQFQCFNHRQNDSDSFQPGKTMFSIDWYLSFHDSYLNLFSEWMLHSKYRSLSEVWANLHVFDRRLGCENSQNVYSSLRKLQWSRWVPWLFDPNVKKIGINILFAGTKCNFLVFLGKEIWNP